MNQVLVEEYITKMPITIRSPNDFIIQSEYCEIICRDMNCNISGVVLIDIQDLMLCKKYKWCISVNGYVWNNKIGYLHKLLLPNSPLVDHKNRNKLDNRRFNLRPATKSQNTCNSKNRGGASLYRGVKKHNCTGKWQATVGHKNEPKGYRYIGLFDTETEAAMAYNVVARELHGEFAFQNKILIRRRK